jgi:hypothetical protein
VLILLRSEAADGDATNRAAFPEPSHQLETAAVRQSNIADQEIELPLGVEGDRGFHGSSDGDVIVVKHEELREHVGTVGMVLDEENALPGRLRAGHNRRRRRPQILLLEVRSDRDLNDQGAPSPRP